MNEDRLVKSAILGVFMRYGDAQKARYALILSGLSSAEVEIASREELQDALPLRCRSGCDIPEHGFALILRSGSGRRIGEILGLMGEISLAPQSCALFRAGVPCRDFSLNSLTQESPT